MFAFALHSVFLAAVVIFRKTQCSHSLCIRFSSPPLFRNSIARGGSLFRISRVSGK